MLLSIKEAAPKLNMAELTLRRQIHAGMVPYRKSGKKYLFTQSDIDEIIANMRVERKTAEVKNENPR